MVEVTGDDVQLVLHIGEDPVCDAVLVLGTDATIQWRRDLLLTGRTRGVVANVVAERHLRTGAKVWVTMPWTGGGLERLEVRGISKGGRIIQKGIARKALDNFRYATVPPHLERAGYAIRHGRPVTWTEPEEPPRWAAALVSEG